MSVLKRDYLPAELENEIAKAGVAGTVVVQARQIFDETRWLLHLAEENPFIEGVVGWADLRSTNLDQQLEELAGHTKLVGVRHVKPPLSTNLPPCESMTVPAPTFLDIHMFASLTMRRHSAAPMAASHAPMKNIVKSSV